MEPIHYLRALKRRWAVILAAVAVAFNVGWFTTDTVAAPRPRPVTYTATTILWNPAVFTDLAGAVTSAGVSSAASFASLPDMLELAAEQMGFEGDPRELRGLIEVSGSDAGFLYISATAPVAREAVTRSETFAESLITFLEGLRVSQLKEEISAMRRRIRVAVQNGVPPDQIASLQTTLSNLIFSRTLPESLEVLQHPTAEPIAVTEFQPPPSRNVRVSIAAGIGLLAGIGLAFVLERFDTRIRTRQAAEEHFGYPVLAEIPVLRRRINRWVVVADRPYGAAADAFRLLAAAVALAGPGRQAPGTNGAGNGGGPGANGNPPRTVLVTSPGPSDGKTTVAANLAAAYRELGKRVLVLSADLRRPAIHRPFGAPVSPGLADTLAEEGALTLEAVPTRVEGVRLVPSGLADRSPGELLASPRMESVLQAARRAADVVILDTSPILVASDVAPLLTKVDAIVLVARANRTRAELAERAGDVLRRLGAPVVGLALNGAKEISMPTSYRRRSHVRALKRSRKEAPVG